ncbi:HTH domain-containing protein [Rubripirellula lacrimiformis]|uniref:HTH domain-containing protein n=1 Tax=Rubripirellula lacrimiformis TaxID=1930273 RepID=UPI00119CB306|nr:HTH domain-containing protein [Rubripirellula lacrimiformis]
MSERDRKIRRNAARDAYNRRRQVAAELRLSKLAALLRNVNVGERGWQSRLAESLNVDRATIHRDLKKLPGVHRKAKEESAVLDFDRRTEFFWRLEESLYGSSDYETGGDAQRATNAEAAPSATAADGR